LVERKRYWLVFLPISASLMVIFTMTHHLNGIVSMVDVGQGDSIFIQEPLNSHVTLIDCGGKLVYQEKEMWKKRKQTSNAEYTLIPFLKYRGVRKIDDLYITHAHEDHYGDLLELANQVRIKHLYYPKGSENNDAFRAVLKQLKKKKVLLHPLLADQKIRYGYLVSPDYVTGSRYLKLSADQGNLERQLNYGFSLRDGEGVTQNYVEAAKYFKLSADQGNSEGQLNTVLLFTMAKVLPRIAFRLQDISNGRQIMAMRWHRSYTGLLSVTAEVLHMILC
jgi:ribonuclease BN (tRNA processing enzyme)